MKGHKRVRVQFYSVEPFDPRGPWDRFPAEQVLDDIASIDFKTKGYLKYNLFDEMMCQVRGSKPNRLLIAWAVDRFNVPFGELEGVVERVPMKEGQGVAKPTYVMFFPGDVAGVIRPTNDCPGTASVAAYIGEYGGCQMMLSALPTPDALSKLQRDPSEILRVRLRIKTKNLKYLVQGAGDLAEAIRVSSKLGSSTVIGLTLAEEQRKHRHAWWNRTKPIVEMIAQSADAFEQAVIDLSGQDAVNLLEERVTTTEWVALDPGRKQLDEDGAARALVRAFQEQQPAILAALGAERSIHGCADSGPVPESTNSRLLGDPPHD